MSSKLEQKRPGFLWGDTFDPATRPGGAGLADYVTAGPGSATLSDDGLGTHFLWLHGLAEVRKDNLAVVPQMVMELDVLVSPTVADGTPLLAICRNSAGFIGDTTASCYSYQELTNNPYESLWSTSTLGNFRIAGLTPGNISAGSWHPFKLSRVGTTVKAVGGANTLTATDTRVNAGPFGISVYCGDAARSVNVRNLAVYTSTAVVVSGLPAGYYVELYTPGVAIWAAAAESSGTATLDCSTVTFGPFGLRARLIVWTSSAKTTQVVVMPDRRHFGGDQWVYAQQPDVPTPLIP